MNSARSFFLYFCLSLLFVSCDIMEGMMRKGSRVAAERAFTPERTYNAGDINVPAGYKVELVTKELTFPTAVAFDEQGNLYVLEAGYSYGPETADAQLLKIEPDGSTTTIVEGDDGPWTGVTYEDGYFYIAAGAQNSGGNIKKVSKDGEVDILLEGLPTLGDHYTGQIVTGPDDYLYFSNGTATNSGVVGVDNWKLEWLTEDDNLEFSDVPCKDIILRGVNYTTDNPLTVDPTDKATTGAYVPFGVSTEDGEVIRGAIPCSGALYKMKPDGSDFQLVAWGFRNPYGLAFSPEGELFLTENGFDARGSRKIVNSLDHLWKIEPGMWYGWPDHSGGVLLTDETFVRKGEENSALLLKEYPNTPPQPAAFFGIHSSSNGIDFSRTNDFGMRGKAFVAQFGDLSPVTSQPASPVGFKVVSVDPKTGEIKDFAMNKQIGPGSKAAGGGFERPISVSFSPDGRSLYVVDFGKMVMSPMGPDPEENSGAVWKITRQERP